jgi:laminin alpha 1/2
MLINNITPDPADDRQILQQYQVAYVIVTSAIAPRPGTWVLERSLDGINYKPWQYFVTEDQECIRSFGLPATSGVPRFQTDDEAICTSFFSKLEPLENGEVHISLVNGRPGIEGPSIALQVGPPAICFLFTNPILLRTLPALAMYVCGCKSCAR